MKNNFVYLHKEKFLINKDMKKEKKRIINRYYQAQMSDIMGNLLTQWSTLSVIGVIDILVVPQLDFYDRIHMIMSRLD